MSSAPVILGTMLFAIAAMAADFDAAWKLDLARSKPSRDLASETMKIEAHRTVIDLVLRSGEKQHQEINRAYDGKEHPATGAGFNGEGVTEICTEVDPATRSVTQKINGKVASEFRLSLSQDGKVLTIVRKGQGAETLVLQRQ